MIVGSSSIQVKLESSERDLVEERQNRRVLLSISNVDNLHIIVIRYYYIDNTPSPLRLMTHSIDLPPPMPAEKIPRRSTLLARYTSLIDKDLPRAATSRSDAQPRWPVHLNHCFGRIILDNICARPWREVIEPPAVRNMTPGQLEQAVQVGEGILSGKVDLERLNRESLQMRAKSRTGHERKSKVDERMKHAIHVGSESPTRSHPATSIGTATTEIQEADRLPLDPDQVQGRPSPRETRKTIRDYFEVVKGSNGLP